MDIVYLEHYYRKLSPLKTLVSFFDSKLSFSDHIYTVANKDFANVNLILHLFCSRNRDLQIKLFNCFVCLTLEFNSPIKSPHLKHDIIVIESTKGLHKKFERIKALFLCAKTIYFKASRFILVSDESTCNHTLRNHVFKLFLPSTKTAAIPPRGTPW